MRRATAFVQGLARWGAQMPAVAQRAFGRTIEDGYIHAGHIAYLAIVTLFPLAILIMAVTAAFGGTEAGRSTIATLLALLPADLAEPFRPVIAQVLAARTGWLLWAGGLVALWTVASFVEALRDISFRAFDTPMERGFLVRRLQSLAGTLIAILLASGIFLLQVLMVVLVRALKQLLRLTIGLPGWIDRATMLDGFVRISQLLTPAMLFLALWALLKLLTPPQFKDRPGWPGALAIAIIWSLGSSLLAPGLLRLFDFGLTYGALSGVMLTLLFFYFLGLALVFGVQLNAALAATTPSRCR